MSTWPSSSVSSLPKSFEPETESSERQSSSGRNVLQGEHSLADTLDDYNYNSTDVFHPSTYERGFIASANFGIFLCVISIFANIVLVSCLCSSKRLRFQYLYIQIMSISLADLGFVITVDSFTVYYELQPWNLGASFCKAWMILDVALPGVSLLALLFLNVDRVLFTYKTRYYNRVMTRPCVRVLVVVLPWVVSCSLVCTLWLGFPTTQPREGICMYGITKAANDASSWLTVFVPSLAILILVIFVFIAVIGEMPSPSSSLPPQTNFNSNNDEINTSDRQRERRRKDDTNYNNRTRLTSAAHSNSQTLTSRKQRKFVAAVLAVDFASLAITLPYSACSLMSPICTDAQSCNSLQKLFQTLSWMRSSVACIQPVLFIFLTDIYGSCKRRFIRWYLGRGPGAVDYAETTDSSGNSERLIRQQRAMARREVVVMTSVIQPKVSDYRSLNSTTTTPVMTPPPSPYLLQGTSSLPTFGKLDSRVQNLLRGDEGTFV